MLGVAVISLYLGSYIFWVAHVKNREHVKMSTYGFILTMITLHAAQ